MFLKQDKALDHCQKQDPTESHKAYNSPDHGGVETSGSDGGRQDGMTRLDRAELGKATYTTRIWGLTGV